MLGCGTAGSFALFRLLEQNKGLKIAVFDAGRPPMKRRHQLYGFLGCLPSGDGKFYVNDQTSVSDVVGYKKTANANKWMLEQLGQVMDTKLIKDSRPSLSAEKRIKKNGFDLITNNYYQFCPKDIHSFSRYIVSYLEKENNNIYSFDNEILQVLKNKNHFSIMTNEGEFHCKKIIVSVGRGGWRWLGNLFNNFGIIEDNNTAEFGIRVEMPEDYMKDFNKSNCSLLKESLDIGPLSWNGTVIPEDHIDMAICSFRSNETRWNSDKVSFNMLGRKYFFENGWQQVDRIGKLTFILGNDRMMKERISLIMNKKSKISVIPEYNWLIEELKELENVMPGLLEKGSFYVPTIMPMTPKINIGSNFSTEVNNMYVAGESAGVKGLYGAALSGMLVADSICKGL